MALAYVDKPWGNEVIFAHTEKYLGKILTITKCVRFVMLAIISKMKGVQYYDIRRDKTRSE